MSIFRPKINVLFEAAKSKVSTLKDAFVDGLKEDLEQNKFFQIIPNDPKSPIIMGMGNNKHLIYYPKNSTPYLHQYENSMKTAKIIDGKIWDKLTDKVYSVGEIIKIYPGENLQPYTKDQECYVQVCVTKIDSIWENICN